MDRRFETVDRRFDAMDKKIEDRFEKLEDRFEGLEGRFEGLEGRFEGLEGRFEGLEGRFEGLEAGVHKINLKLENIIEPKIQNIYDNQSTIIELHSTTGKMSATLDKHDGDVYLLKKQCLIIPKRSRT